MTTIIDNNILQTILPPKRLEISSINPNESETTPKKVIQAKLTNPYCIKLRKTISTHSSIEGINTYNFSNLSIDTKGSICQFNCL